MEDLFYFHAGFILLFWGIGLWCSRKLLLSNTRTYNPKKINAWFMITALGSITIVVDLFVGPNLIPKQFYIPVWVVIMLVPVSLGYQLFRIGRASQDQI